VRSIERSIEQGWQGLFDPEEQRGNAGGPAGSAAASAAWDRIRTGLRKFGTVQPGRIKETFDEEEWPPVWAAVRAAGGYGGINDQGEDARPFFVAAFDRCKEGKG
jgi:hypothetical protein